ncbi:MAG: hypothetical protein JW822_06345 [Spirochaetales bacterium]|nr:hypothetical protein [Spirochaetales bacterium]
MDLQVKEYNELIVDCCKIILQSHKNLEYLLEEYDFHSSNRAEIDRNLIAMSVASNKMLELVYPLPTSGEIHGLPKEATTEDFQDDVLIVDKDHPKWNFIPWFKEKTIAIVDAVRELMELLEQNPSKLNLKLKVAMTSKDYIKMRIESKLRHIPPYAQTILNMIESGRLSITNVRLEEEE